MARLPRLHIPGGWYYVTLRGYRDRDLFPRPSQRWVFERTIAEAAAQTGIHVHAFCLMDTHARVLVEVAEIPIRVFMQILGSRYARALRATAQFSGRLFRERHDAALIDADRYLLDLLCAIHLEPVRAGGRAAATGIYMVESPRLPERRLATVVMHIIRIEPVA